MTSGCVLPMKFEFRVEEFRMKSLKRTRPRIFNWVSLLLAISILPGIARAEGPAIDVEHSSVPSFGGPDSVSGQLTDDEIPRGTWTGVNILKSYNDWKARLRKDHGISLTVDYTAAILGATETMGDYDYGSGGAARFFGSWDLVGRESGNTGTFVWKVENRHRISDIPASQVASEAGYAGLALPTLSNIGTRLTNLYWKQLLREGRLEIIGGMLDTTDWVDVYALASPWTGFFNFSLATGSATIPVPDDATLGVYVNAMLTENVYIIGGLSDSNADSTDPFNGFDTFIDDNEYFKTIELGWTTAKERFYLDNMHLTLWHVDEREKAGVSEGWGASFSYAKSYDEKWMPFLRGGYADDGGSLLQKSLSTGVGYHFRDEISLLGLGFNWGQPNEDTYGASLKDQYSTELFCRLQVAENFQLTPDVQLVINPALNPTADESWIFGLRGRLIF